MPDLTRSTRTESWMVEHRWPTATTTLGASTEAQAYKLAALYEDKGVPGRVFHVVTTTNFRPLPTPGGTDEH